MSSPTEDIEEVPYYDLAVETTEEFLPDRFEEDENFKSVLFTGLLRILTVYDDSEDEPWVQHPGDEYIIGSIIRAVEDPQYMWTEWYSPYATLSEGEYRAHGNELVTVLEDEYGQAAEESMGGMINMRSTQLLRPSGDLTKDDLKDYSPGDGFYRDRPETNTGL
jgi:hypothetical protein